MRASTRRPGSSPRDDDDGEPRAAGDLQRLLPPLNQSAGKKAGGLVSLYCRGAIRKVLRAGRRTRTPPSWGYGTAAWLELIRNLYAAHAQLTNAWAQAAAPAPREAAAAAARLEEAGAAWDEATGVTGEARKKQMTAPGLQEPAKQSTRHPGPRMGTASPPTAITR